MLGHQSVLQQLNLQLDNAVVHPPHSSSDQQRRQEEAVCSRGWRLLTNMQTLTFPALLYAKQAGRDCSARVCAAGCL